MKKKILITLFFGAAMFSESVAQLRDDFTTNLGQQWQLEAVEIKGSGKKMPPAKKMQKNYLHFKRDGTFRSMEAGTIINGKWRADETKLEIEIFDFDNQNLTSPVIFNIVSLSKTRLAISNNPPTGEPVIMHYVAKAPRKNKR